MAPDTADVFRTMQERYGAGEAEVQREDLAFQTLPLERAVEAIRHARDRLGYAHLAFMTVVDRIEDGVFDIVYMLTNPGTHHDLGLVVQVDREKPVMESIHELWAAAMVYERELHEMFGMQFPGCPRVEESFALEGWQEMPPMRRDFDSRKYSEDTYFPRPGRVTHDPREYMKQKLYADE